MGKFAKLFWRCNYFMTKLNAKYLFLQFHEKKKPLIKSFNQQCTGESKTSGCYFYLGSPCIHKRQS